MIKKLDKKSVKEIIEIHKKSIFPLWDKLNREYIIDDVEKFVTEVFNQGKVFGYFVGDKLVGVLGFRIPEIDFLLVNPNFQEHGIGSQLMNLAEKELSKKTRRIVLQVLTKNSAVKFYQKLGYEIISEKNNKYTMEKQFVNLF